MGLLDRVKRIKNREFMEAVAAACAMVASVDGLVRPEEAAKVIDYAQIDDTLAVFDSYEVMETFEAYVRTFEFDYNVGRQKAFEAVRKLAGRREQARLLVLVCMAVADADGEFDNNQRLAVRDVCRVAGMSLKEFDLDLRAPSPRELPPETTAPRRREPPPEWMRDPQKALERAKAHQRVREEARKAKEPPVFPVPMPEEKPVERSSAVDSNSGSKAAGEGSSPPSKETAANAPAADERKPNFPSPEPEIERADLPEWMRNPPASPPGRIESGDSAGGKRGSGKQSAPPIPNDLPEWMRNPPPPENRSREKRDVSDGRKGKAEDSETSDESLPEWMRNPVPDAPDGKPRPDSRPAAISKESQNELSEWMPSSGADSSNEKGKSGDGAGGKEE